MDRHLEPPPESFGEDVEDFDEAGPPARPPWWRWVAVVVVIAMVVATPFAFVLYHVLH